VNVCRTKEDFNLANGSTANTVSTRSTYQQLPEQHIRHKVNPDREMNSK